MKLKWLASPWSHARHLVGNLAGEVRELKVQLCSRLDKEAEEWKASHRGLEGRFARLEEKFHNHLDNHPD